MFRALSAGSELPACLVSEKAACRAWSAVRADEFRGEFLDGEPGAAPVYTAGGSAADDSPSCRDSPGDSHKLQDAADSNNAAGDKDSPIRPNKRDCNKRVARPSSIPIRPIPKAGPP